jgi:Fe-S cluster assembly protein SufD
MNADTDLYASAAARIRERHPGLAWLDAQRSAALATLSEAGLPDARAENWRYTRLDEFSRRSAEWLGSNPLLPSATAANVAPIAGLDGVHVALIDGIVAPSSRKAVAGLRVESLGSADAAARQRVTAGTVAAAGALDPALTALNTALLSDALLVSTAPGSTIADPLCVSVFSTGQPVAAQPRLLVDLGARSQLTLIVRHCGHASSLVNIVSSIRAAAGARLRLYRLQEMPDEGLLLESTHIVVDRDATVDVMSLDLGGRLSRHELKISLDGEGSAITVRGLFIADGRRHVDNHTQVDHRARQTSSRELFHGLIDEHGRGVFNGKVVVHPGASGTDAQLTNRNLLLSATAEVDTKPELEIHADEVRCSHGATTGQLDANALFYLRSRGLDATEARRALVQAFARQIIQPAEGAGVPAALQRYLDDSLDRRLVAGTGLP